MYILPAAKCLLTAQPPRQAVNYNGPWTWQRHTASRAVVSAARDCGGTEARAGQPRRPPPPMQPRAPCPSIYGRKRTKRENKKARNRFPAGARLYGGQKAAAAACRVRSVFYTWHRCHQALPAAFALRRSRSAAAAGYADVGAITGK